MTPYLFVGGPKHNEVVTLVPCSVALIPSSKGIAYEYKRRTLVNNATQRRYDVFMYEGASEWETWQIMALLRSHGLL